MQDGFRRNGVASLCERVSKLASQLALRGSERSWRDATLSVENAERVGQRLKMKTLSCDRAFPGRENRDLRPTDQDLSAGTPTRGHPGLLALDAVVVAEHRRKEKLADRYGRLARTRLLEQGDAALSFYAIDERAGRAATAGGRD